MNKILLIGNLTRDPELSQTGSGIPMCKFSIAVNRNYTNASGERETDFFNVVTWRGLAENCSRFLRKGLKVGVAGSLNTRTYEQDGIKKYATDVVADEVEFLTPKDAQGAGSGDTYREKEYGAKKSVKDAVPLEDDGLPF